MPCITDTSLSDEVRHFQILLCQACRFLTKEQIDSLKNDSGIYYGLDWYKQHLHYDAVDCDNSDEEKIIAIKELDRLGYIIVNSNGGTTLAKKE